MEEGYDAINLARAIALARGEPLVPLPPEALTLRGSRSIAARGASVDVAAAAPEPAGAGGAAVDEPAGAGSAATEPDSSLPQPDRSELAEGR